MYRTEELLDLSKTIAAPLFEGAEYPWEVLDKIKDFIWELGDKLDPEKYVNPTPGVWIAKGAEVFPTAWIDPPCIIDEGAHIRHCAFIRGSAIIGKDAVVGNSVEVKNAILFDGVQVPHYNYVGDSVLGYKAHMGAGAVTSNVKSDKTNVVVKNGEEHIPTGRKKFGAVIGDNTEVGCNSVLNPGTVLGRNCQVYPASSVRGVLPEGHIFKAPDNIVKKD